VDARTSGSRFKVFVWVDKADAPAREIGVATGSHPGDHQLTIHSATFSVKDMPTGQWYPISVTGTTPENHCACPCGGHTIIGCSA